MDVGEREPGLRGCMGLDGDAGGYNDGFEDMVEEE